MKSSHGYSIDEKIDLISLGIPHALFRISNYVLVFSYYAVAGNGMRLLIAEANRRRASHLTSVTNWVWG